MKIAVCAAHSNGKTTFCKDLQKATGYNYIYDVVREEAVKKGFGINENTPPEVQAWLAMRQWELERNTSQPWIADKCLLDYMVYGDIVLKDEEIKRFIRHIIKRNVKYDIVFYIPPEIPLEEDGVRSIDPKFREIVDKHYKEVLDELGIKYITISGSREERVAQALEHLK